MSITNINTQNLVRIFGVMMLNIKSSKRKKSNLCFYKNIIKLLNLLTLAVDPSSSGNGGGGLGILIILGFGCYIVYKKFFGGDNKPLGNESSDSSDSVSSVDSADSVDSAFLNYDSPVLNFCRYVYDLVLRLTGQDGVSYIEGLYTNSLNYMQAVPNILFQNNCLLISDYISHFVNLDLAKIHLSNLYITTIAIASDNNPTTVLTLMILLTAFMIRSYILHRFPI